MSSFSTSFARCSSTGVWIYQLLTVTLKCEFLLNKNKPHISANENSLCPRQHWIPQSQIMCFSEREGCYLYKMKKNGSLWRKWFIIWRLTADTYSWELCLLLYLFSLLYLMKCILTKCVSNSSLTFSHFKIWVINTVIISACSGRSCIFIIVRDTKWHKYEI